MHNALFVMRSMNLFFLVNWSSWVLLRIDFVSVFVYFMIDCLCILLGVYCEHRVVVTDTWQNNNSNDTLLTLTCLLRLHICETSCKPDCFVLCERNKNILIFLYSIFWLTRYIYYYYMLSCLMPGVRDSLAPSGASFC